MFIKSKPKPHKKDLLLIHGAWATNAAFNHLVRCLEGHENLGEVHYCPYDIQRRTLPQVIDIASNHLEYNIEKPTVIVGHSMGGIIALNLHDNPHADSIVTAASPIDGLCINKFIQGVVMWRSPSLVDAFAFSNFIGKMHAINFSKPIDCLVTTAGFNMMMHEKNDCVVSVRSQHNFVPKSASMHYVPYNHNEVLQADEFVAAVRKRLETRIDDPVPGSASTNDGLH